MALFTLLLAALQAPSAAATAPPIGLDSPLRRTLRASYVFADHGPRSVHDTQIEARRGASRLSLTPGGFCLSTLLGEGNGSVLRFEVEGADRSACWRGVGELRGREHFLLGTDPHRWTTELPLYERAELAAVVPGVDLIFRDDAGVAEYLLRIAPCAKRSEITLRCEGADALEQAEDGSLVIRSGPLALRHTAPVAFRVGADGEESPIPCRAELLGGCRFVLRWEAPAESDTIVIDPGLLYGTYLGGHELDEGRGVAGDNSGHAFATGGTASTFAFPVTPGAFDTSSVSLDYFITKIDTNATGSSGLVYSTFVGSDFSGSIQPWEFANAIDVDQQGAAYVIGTFHIGFPTTPGAFKPTNSIQTGGALKLNADGNGLIYSTYLGGYGEAIDLFAPPDGRIYVTGYQISQPPPFPTTPGAFQPSGSFSFARAIFIAKLNSTGSGLLYGTLCGGSGTPASVASATGRSVVSLPDGSALVAGYTLDEDFPTTAGAYQTQFGFGSEDAVVFKLNPTGSQLLFSTYLGSPQAPFPAVEEGYAVGVDSAGCPIVMGVAYSDGLPTTVGAFDTTQAGIDMFLVKLTPDGSDLMYSTRLGGNGTEPNPSYLDMVVDPSGAAYVTSITTSGSFPVTPDAYDLTHNGGGRDGFLSVLAPSGDRLLYSTFVGSSNDTLEDFDSVYLAPDGTVYLSGRTNGTTFPVTPNAFDATSNNSPITNTDAFVVRLELPSPPVLSGLSKVGIGTPGCLGYHTLWATSAPTLGNMSFAVECSVAPASSLGLLIVSADALDGAADPLGIGVDLWIDLFSPEILVFDLPSNASGLASVNLQIPANPQLAGEEYTAQAFWLWPASTCAVSPHQLSSSNGLRITLAP